MKILVCYRINEYSTKMSGVFKKFRGQVSALSDEGIDTLGMYMSRSTFTVSRAISGVLTPQYKYYDVPIEGERERFWKLAMDYVSKVDIDIVYCRYDQMYDGTALAQFLRACKQKGSLCVVEFPTYPYAKEIKDPVKRLADQSNQMSLVDATDFFMSTSKVSAISGKQNVFFNNMVNPYDRLVADKTNSQGFPVRAVAVANVSFWHGFDRLLYGMKQLSTEQLEGFHLTIVGEGDAVATLKELVHELGLERNVSFSGFLSGQALADVYAQAHIGIDTLAPHRKDIHLVSSIKAREYLLNGLPVVTTRCDEALLACPFAYHVEANELPLDIPEIMSFVESVTCVPESSDAITQYATEKLSWKVWVKKLAEKAGSQTLGQGG